MAILLKTKKEIEIMAEGGKKLAEILGILKNEVREGTRSDFFDSFSRKLIRQAGAEPAFLNYRSPESKKPYPAAICVSVNETVVHGLPSEYVIRSGDVVKLDLGIKYQGFYVDSALTVGVGQLDSEKKKLVATTESALSAGIKEAKIGKTLGDIGFAIENLVRKSGFSVAENLCGHGIGRQLHEDPSVLNSGQRGQGEDLEEGMVLSIEPMVATGSGRVRQLSDNSFVTADGSLSAHFEHTVAVTRNGPKILTKI